MRKLNAVDRRDREIAEAIRQISIQRITFEATEAAVGIDKIECSLQQPFTPCISPVVYDRLSGETLTNLP
jgi:hypothetical protein